MRLRWVLGAGLGFALVAGTPVALASSASGSVRPSMTTAAPCTSASYDLTVGVATSGTTWTVSAMGQVDFVHDDLTANVTLPSNLPVPALAGATLQVELVDGTAYVAVPPALAGFVGGAPWVSIALPSGISRGIDGLLARGATWCANSQSLVRTLARGSSVSSLNTASTGTRGQEVRVPGRNILPALHVPKALTTKAQGSFGTGQVPVDVWSSGQGHLQGINFTAPSISVNLQLSETNQPVTITAPTGAVPLAPGLVGLLGGLL